MRLPGHFSPLGIVGFSFSSLFLHPFAHPLTGLLQWVPFFHSILIFFVSIIITGQPILILFTSSTVAQPAVTHHASCHRPIWSNQNIRQADKRQKHLNKTENSKKECVVFSFFPTSKQKPTCWAHIWYDNWHFDWINGFFENKYYY